MDRDPEGIRPTPLSGGLRCDGHQRNAEARPGALEHGKLSVAIRVDASVAIGTGHVMRCLTLARLLQSTGARVVFLCRALPGSMIAFLESAGQRVLVLGEGRDNVAAWDASEDAAETLAALARCDDRFWSLLVVDHYGLDRGWERRVRARFGTLFVIDDLANRPHDCDALLDQNFYPNATGRYGGWVPLGCKLFLGPAFGLLRDEFYALRRRVRTREGPVRRALLFFGGSDPTGETGKALAAFTPRPGVELDVVVGASNPQGDALERACSGRRDARFHRQTPRIAELMAEADFSVGAGGAATWERCMLGLPTLTLTVAENQVEAAVALHAYGAIHWLGHGPSLSEAALRDGIGALLDDDEGRRRISARSLELMTPAAGGSPLLPALASVVERSMMGGIA